MSIESEHATTVCSHFDYVSSIDLIGLQHQRVLQGGSSTWMKWAGRACCRPHINWRSIRKKLGVLAEIVWLLLSQHLFRTVMWTVNVVTIAQNASSNETTLLASVKSSAHVEQVDWRALVLFVAINCVHCSFYLCVRVQFAESLSIVAYDQQQRQRHALRYTDQWWAFFVSTWSCAARRHSQ